MRLSEFSSFLIEYTIGIDTLVLRNPTAQALYNLVATSRDGEARGLTMGHDMFWWDAYKEIHGEAAEQLGIPYLKEYDNRLYAKMYDGVVSLSADTEAAPLFRRIAMRAPDKFQFNMLGAKWEADDFLRELNHLEGK